MSFFKLCSDDPVVSELRDVFKANIIRIPEERIAPFTMLVSSKGTVRFIGHVGSLLEGPTFETPLVDVQESNMANLSNRRSRLVDGEIGLQILSGLLKGMGGSSTPDVSAHLKDAKMLRFNFPAVRRRYVEIARIGQLLAGRSFNRANLLFKTLLDPKATVHLIDSIITSTDFEIDAGDEAEATLKVDAQRLQNVLAGAKIDVIAKGVKQIAFRSNRRLAFAFTCVNVGISSNGAIRAIAPSSGKIGPPLLINPNARDRGHESHVLLTRAPELIDMEFDS